MPLTSVASDSIVTDSANSQSAYNTGHKSAVNALGVYASRTANTLEHPKVETLAEVARRKLGMAVGIVTNTEIQDATPAGVFAHTRCRADDVPITKQMLDFKPDVAMGGGSASFLPKSVPGSRRSDETDMLAAFRNAGYAFADTRTAPARSNWGPGPTRPPGSSVRPARVMPAIVSAEIQAGPPLAEPDIRNQVRHQGARNELGPLVSCQDHGLADQAAIRLG